MAIEEITDDRIRALTEMHKSVVNPDARRRTEMKYERVNYEVSGDSASDKFQIFLRQSTVDPEDFSCGIRWLMPSGESLILARYNGANHVHDDIRFTFHIHRATEAAIKRGFKPERHAEVTPRYRTLAGALHCLLADFNVSGLDSPQDQPELFDET